MPGLIFNIQPTSKLLDQLTKGVRRAGSVAWTRRVFSQASAIGQQIGIMLVKAFENTLVAQSLRGQGSEDLPAHFGLDDGTANALVNGMGDLIRSSIRLSSISKKGVVSIRIQAVEKDWVKYLSLPGAQYRSQPSNITIPVVRWLLIDPNIDIGQAAYDIVFHGEDERFDARIQKVSRSGRAIMVSLESLGGGGGYVLPGIISGQFGQNFIEFALGQPDIAKRAAIILMDKVK